MYFYQYDQNDIIVASVVSKQAPVFTNQLEFDAPVDIVGGKYDQANNRVYTPQFNEVTEEVFYDNNIYIELP